MTSIHSGEFLAPDGILLTDKLRPVREYIHSNTRHKRLYTPPSNRRVVSSRFLPRPYNFCHLPSTKYINLPRALLPTRNLYSPFPRIHTHTHPLPTYHISNSLVLNFKPTSSRHTATRSAPNTHLTQGRGDTLLASWVVASCETGAGCERRRAQRRENNCCQLVV